MAFIVPASLGFAAARLAHYWLGVQALVPKVLSKVLALVSKALYFSHI